MSADTKKSFTVIVATFLRSKESKKYTLTVYHREVLRVIANYLDMPFGSCFAKQQKLSEECGMSVRKFKYTCDELVTKKLLERTKSHKLYHYELSTLRCITCT